MKQTYEVAKKVINWLGLSWLIVNKLMRSKRLDSIRSFQWLESMFKCDTPTIIIFSAIIAIDSKEKRDEKTAFFGSNCDIFVLRNFYSFGNFT